MTQHTRNIILDTLVLVAFSSVLGGLSLLISKSFSGEDNPALDLITVMKKAEAKEVNASTEKEEREAREKGMQEFEQNLEKGEKLAEKQGKAFVNMTDPHGRTITIILKQRSSWKPSGPLIWEGFCRIPA